MNTKESERLLTEAERLIPGGVNSPVRAYKAVGGVPRFVSRAKGAHVWDADGNRYVDYVLSWGPLVLGHAHPTVVGAIQTAAERGTSFGAPTRLEVELAALLVEAMPSVEMVRLVNSGTEATMSALRVARAYTGRALVVKFAGCYHGHGDAFLVSAGSGPSSLGLSDSPGIPARTAETTLVAPFNDLDAVAALFNERGEDIAAVIAEPLIANMGFIRPAPGFLAGIQDLCHRFGALFILDEVITGFRIDLRGAQGLWDLDPDLTCMGKVIGGGIPTGAYGGKRRIMEMVAPSGPVYQAGTLAGNPLATTAGIATLLALHEYGVFSGIAEQTRVLAQGIRDCAKQRGVAVQVDSEGTILGLYFLRDEGAQIVDYSSAKQHADPERYSCFFHSMLEQGYYFAPSQFEVAFVSLAHDADIVQGTLGAIDQAFQEVAAWQSRGCSTCAK